MKLTQREVAERLGVVEASVWNWESNSVEAELRCMPVIIRFLGYNPLPPAERLADRLVRQRTPLGLSRKQAAQLIGVDPSTLARWERGELVPTGPFAARADRFLSTSEQDQRRNAERTA